ncbi:MAG: class I SAM-dependent methyltransferase [Desulfuromonadaceae bacterium]|nr:class I SAM-dependent methyltransferase [Desulfuromonadaceae bacterium]MDD5105698.1 class I SAM-dependent methyltransferase [Desulfuromonadaceae bacterium]
MFQRFISKQLARPSGLFGRLFTARWLEKANTEMNALTLDRLALNADDRLIEIGFGSGYLLEQILTGNSCAFAAGVEISNDMVKRVFRRLRESINAGRAEVRFGDIENIPYKDAEFSKLCSVNTLYFWKSPSAALAECRRVLKDGGMIALCFNSKSDLAAWPGHVHQFTLYDLAEVEEMLTDAGFCEIEVASGNDPAQGLFYCVTGVVA